MTDLSAQVQQLVDAAVDAELSHYYFFPQGGGLYERWVYEGTEQLYLSSHDTYVKNMPDAALFTPAGVVEKWQSKLTDFFRFWHSLPQPSAFEPHIQDLCTTLLWINMAPTGDSHGSGPVGTGVIPYRLGIAHDQLDALSGVTIDAFNSEYLKPLGDTLSLYHLSLESAIKAIVTEQEMWRRTEDAITDLADKARTAFEGSHIDTSIDIKAIFKVIGTLNGIIGLVPSPVSAAFGAVAKVTGVLDSVWPASPREEDEPPLGADHPDRVFDNMGAALEKLEKSILAVEGAADERLEKVRTAMGDPLFSPTRSNIGGADPGGLVSDAQLLEYDATLYATTEVHLPVAVEFLRKAGNHLLSSENIGAWQGGRPPGVGLGYSGHYDSFFLVLHGLKDDMTNLSHDLEIATDVLHQTGLRFDTLTEAQVVELSELRKKVESEAVHVLG